MVLEVGPGVVEVVTAVASVVKDAEDDARFGLVVLELMVEELTAVLIGLTSGLAKGPGRGLATLRAMMPEADMLVGP